MISSLNVACHFSPDLAELAHAVRSNNPATAATIRIAMASTHFVNGFRSGSGTLNNAIHITSRNR
jgi:hypothetical protein